MLKEITNININLHVILDEFEPELGLAHYYAYAVILSVFFLLFKNSKNLVSSLKY